ncbi:MAG: gamma-glutamyl-phosphate reductase, partial [bacterium]
MSNTTTTNAEDQNVDSIAQDARDAYFALSRASSAEKNQALEAIAEAIEANRQNILEANERDLEAGRETGLSEALLDRLTLTPDRIDSMVDGVRQVISLDDPVGQIIDETERPNGLVIQQ